MKTKDEIQRKGRDFSVKTESSPISFVKMRNVCIFAISKPILSFGVACKEGWQECPARQRSAKPCTAVRIRFRPHRNRVAAIYNAVLFLNCHTFVIPTFIRGWFLQYKITSYRYPDEFGGLLDSFYHLILAIVFGLHLV